MQPWRMPLRSSSALMFLKCHNPPKTLSKFCRVPVQTPRSALFLRSVYSAMPNRALWAERSSLVFFFFPPPLDTLESSLQMDTCCAPPENTTGYILERHTVQAGGFTGAQTAEAAEISFWRSETKLTTGNTWGFHHSGAATIAAYLSLSLHPTVFAFIFSCSKVKNGMKVFWKWLSEGWSLKKRSTFDYTPAADVWSKMSCTQYLEMQLQKVQFTQNSLPHMHPTASDYLCEPRPYYWRSVSFSRLTTSLWTSTRI